MRPEKIIQKFFASIEIFWELFTFKKLIVNILFNRHNFFISRFKTQL